MDNFRNKDRRRDDNKKQKKTLSLTPEGIAQIQAYADQHNTSFSATIEMLALDALGADTATVTIPYLMNAMQKMINANFNRMAKLTSMAAIEAGASRELTAAFLLLTLKGAYLEYGDGFDEKIRVGKVEDYDRNIRGIQKRIQNMARKRSVDRLKSPLAEITQILYEQDRELLDEDQ